LNPRRGLGGEKEKMNNKGKMAIGGVIAFAVLATTLVVLLSASAYDHDQTYNANSTYFVPEIAPVPDGYCHDTTVDIWTNTSVAIASGYVVFEYTQCCADVTNFQFNTTNWQHPDCAWFDDPGRVRIRFLNITANGPGPVHLGTVTIHCCNTSSCCLTNMTWNVTYPSYLEDDMGAEIENVGWKDGVFVCGNPINVTKTVKDPTTGLWVEGYSFPMGTKPGVNVTFNITVHAKCCNLTNITVIDVLDDSLTYYPGNATVNGQACEPQVVGQNLTWSYNAGGCQDIFEELDQCNKIYIEFNATVNRYGKDYNTVTADGWCNETVLPVPVSDTDDAWVEIPPPALIEVEKKVWNKTAGKWVDVIQGAKIGEIYRFNCTIHNSGSRDLTDIRFWDILNSSLEYAGNATLKTPDGVTRNIELPGNYVFKLKTLHPENLSWDPSSPICNSFHELCPEYCNTYHLKGWIDWNEDLKLSPCDQILLDTATECNWYHVEKLPWTSGVTRKVDGQTMYIDSKKDNQELDLADRGQVESSQWNRVCRPWWQYLLWHWDDENSDGKVSACDQITLKEKWSGVSREYHVDNVTIDLIVSREWPINSWLQDNLTLHPCQSIVFEFDARVVNYGNDSNVQCVKGYSAVGDKWVSDCDDAWIDTPKPDLNVSKITVNEDVPYLCDMAFGPTNHTGARTQCNNISAVIEEDNGVDVVFPFNVTFLITNTSTGAEVGKCVKRLPGLAAGANETVWCNCSFYPFAYENYSISVTVDSNCEIRESDETNNTMVRNITAHEYGWKGDSWQDGRNITALQCHEQGTINLTYSAGNSTRLSAYWHPHWTDYYVEWTRDDFSVIPSTDTCIKKARLYVYYDWDKSTGQNITDYLSLTFNGFAKTPVVYTDIKAPDLIGSCSCPDYMHDLYPSCDPGYTTTYYDICSSNYRYGMLAYDVTDEFILDGNIAHLQNAYPGGNNVSIDGMLLVVVYNHPDEPERIIWINEGFDILKSGLTRYTKCTKTGEPTIYHWGPTGISPEEATTYATFTPFPECPEIPMNRIGSVRLVTVTKDATPGAADGKKKGHALYFNGELLGMDTVWGSSSGVRNAINDTIVPVHLLKSSNNTVAFRSYGDIFEATNAFLILEKSPREIKVEDKLVQPQEEFTVNVTVDTHGLDVYGVQYKLYYDNSVLRAEMQNKGPFLGQTGSTNIIKNEIHHNEGYVEYAESMKGTGCTVGNGTLATIEFIAIGERGAESALEFRDVKFYDCNGNEVNNSISTDGRVKINENHPPVPVPGSMHTINNVAKKYPCVTTLCACKSYDPDAPSKGGNISYVRWAFGDGQYGTSEGLENCHKEHEYTSYNWYPIGNPDGHYVPMDVMLTVTDDGCPPLTNSSSIPVNVYIAGDANGDGEVDIGDAVWIGLHWEETCNADNEYCGCTNCAWATEMQDGADLNNDCEIDIGDAVLVGANWEHTAW